jgi:hypothetical protein
MKGGKKIFTHIIKAAREERKFSKRPVHCHIAHKSLKISSRLDEFLELNSETDILLLKTENFFLT